MEKHVAGVVETEPVGEAGAGLLSASAPAGAAPSWEPIQFDERHFDVTDQCVQACCIVTCPAHFIALIPGILGRKTLVLEPEEATLTTECDPCCTITTRRPYGELESVDAVNLCCCVGVSSGLTRGIPLFPGLGCQGDDVDEIVFELKQRMKERGDTGNIRRLEAQFQVTQELKAELAALRRDVSAIMDHLQVPPPANNAPIAAAMDR